MKKMHIMGAPVGRSLLTIATAAVVAACGGGGSGGGLPFLPISTAPAPAPDPAVTPVPAVDGSGPCVNEADFHPGTVLEFEAKAPGAAADTRAYRQRRVTEAREAFANTTPVTFNLGTRTQSNEATAGQGTLTSVVTHQRKEYRDIVQGRVVVYGDRKEQRANLTSTVPGLASTSSTFVETKTFDPPLSFPVDMKPGEVAAQRSVRTEATTSDAFGTATPVTSSSSTAGRFELTYHGREALQTPLGSFSTCKFTYVLEAEKSGVAIQANKDYWVAADGAYRGQILKESKAGSAWEATTLTYTPQ